jgi:hypothetical protein
MGFQNSKYDEVNYPHRRCYGSYGDHYDSSFINVSENLKKFYTEHRESVIDFINSIKEQSKNYRVFTKSYADHLLTKEISEEFANTICSILNDDIWGCYLYKNSIKFYTKKYDAEIIYKFNTNDESYNKYLNSHYSQKTINKCIINVSEKLNRIEYKEYSFELKILSYNDDVIDSVISTYYDSFKKHINKKFKISYKSGKLTFYFD